MKYVEFSVNKPEISEFLLSLDIDKVLFDFDLTVTAVHSRGMIRRKCPDVLEAYINSALETDAIEVMRVCAELGFKVGVVTFQKDVNDEAYLGGVALVELVLEHMKVSHIFSKGSIVALSGDQYEDMIMNSKTYTKNNQIFELLNAWGATDCTFEVKKTLLIDDSKQNISAFSKIGGHGLLVNGSTGFHINECSYLCPCTESSMS
eukprot:430441_1